MLIPNILYSILTCIALPPCKQSEGGVNAIELGIHTPLGPSSGNVGVPVLGT